MFHRPPERRSAPVSVLTCLDSSRGISDCIVVVIDSSKNLDFRSSKKMSRVYVGNLDPRVTERELEDEFRIYGVLRRFHLAKTIGPIRFGGVSVETRDRVEVACINHALCSSKKSIAVVAS